MQVCPNQHSQLRLFERTEAPLAVNQKSGLYHPVPLGYHNKIRCTRVNVDAPAFQVHRAAVASATSIPVLPETQNVCAVDIYNINHAGNAGVKEILLPEL